jgi:hypothetical protein
MVTAEYLGAGAALLGVAGGILRYLLKITTAIESASRVAASTFAALERHAADSERRHEILEGRVGQHDTQLAVLQSRMDRP